MYGFAILNANKEIMGLGLQTDYFCPGVKGVSILATQAKPRIHGFVT